MLIHLSISTNIWTFFFPELKNLNFDDWNFLRNWKCLQVWQLSCKGKKAGYAALKITRIQIFKLRPKKNSCVWWYDKCFSTFWEKYLVQLIGTTNTNLEFFFNEFFVYLLFEFFLNSKSINWDQNTPKNANITNYTKKIKNNFPTL